ncbi:uncharacterized protein LOC143200469 [Rhynchophorus ferrugineus]
MDVFAVQQFENNSFPQFLTKDQLQTLPLGVLKRLSAVTLWEIWNDLNEEIKANTELQGHLPCLEHFNRPEDECHFDGPPPSKYRCSVCKLSEPLMLANNNKDVK